MTVNATSARATTSTSAASSTLKAGTLGSEAAKLNGEADVVRMLQASSSESTAQGGTSYAEQAVSKTLEDNKMYLASLLGTGAPKVMEKIQTKVADYMKANPNASEAQVDKAVKDAFNNESLGAKIFKDVIDKLLQETLSRIREAAE